MINILIVEKSFSNCKKIIKKISKYDENMRFCEIANSEKEAINALKIQKIDVLLLGKDFYKNDKYNFFKNFSNYIICIDDKMYEDFEILKIIKNINENVRLISKNEKRIRNEIKTELQYLGDNLMYNGSIYLAESIFMLYNLNEWFEFKLESDVYPIIAKKYNKTTNNIKCNIIYATNSMFYECEEKKLINYFGYYKIYKPGPKKIIYEVLNRIKK